MVCLDLLMERLKLLACAWLLVPKSLVQAFPLLERYKFPSVDIQGAQALQTRRIKPTTTKQPTRVPPVVDAFRAPPPPLGETPRNLRDLVGAPLLVNKKHTTAPTAEIGVDAWLHEARQARDKKAVQWFTGTILGCTPPPRPRKRPRLHLNTRWGSWYKAMDEAIRRHLCTVKRA